MIAGLESPTSGQILMQGKDVTTLGPADRNVSMMFQSYALFPHMNVLENVMYGLRNVGRGQRKRHVARWRPCAMWDWWAYDDRLPSELSGGQQQRVALARALVLEPAVLLFDEPLSNLDARLRREMREEIRTLQQRLQLTVAYVTHDQSEALAVSDQIIVMDDGLIAQRGTPQDMYEYPQTSLSPASWARPCCSRPWPIRAEAPSTRSAAHHARQPVAAGKVKVAVRPEAWHIGPPGLGWPNAGQGWPIWAATTSTPSRPNWAPSLWCRPT
jgi:iron(III) transport system ATP-binding protein